MKHRARIVLVVVFDRGLPWFIAPPISFPFVLLFLLLQEPKLCDPILIMLDLARRYSAPQPAGP